MLPARSSMSTSTSRDEVRAGSRTLNLEEDAAAVEGAGEEPGHRRQREREQKRAEDLAREGREHTCVQPRLEVRAVEEGGQLLGGHVGEDRVEPQDLEG